MADAAAPAHPGTNMPQPERHRLQLHCPNGNPSEATLHLDGEQIMWASRIEFVLDCNTRQATVRLTAPAALLDIDVDAAAFVTAHTEDIASA